MPVRKTDLLENKAAFKLLERLGWAGSWTDGFSWKIWRNRSTPTLAW